MTTPDPPQPPNALNPIGDVWVSPLKLNGNIITSNDANVWFPVQYSFTGRKWFSKIEVRFNALTAPSTYEIRFTIASAFSTTSIMKDLAYESMKRGIVTSLWELNTTANVALPNFIIMGIQRHLLDGTLAGALAFFITHVRAFERNDITLSDGPQPPGITNTDTSTDTLTNDP